MTVTHPRGFTAAGVAAGLKSTGALDLALVVNQGPTYDSATVFTANRCKANPILWSQEVVKDGVVRAVVLNSGGANCYTGPEGFRTTHAVAEKVADCLGIGAIDVVVCSTGLIGLANDRDDLLAGVDAATAALSYDGGAQAAEAIMTTDSVSKNTVVEGAGWSIGGMAKGAGMLAPALATMLVVITTDAVVPAAELDAALRCRDPGQLRPARLRRVHVHQRHGHGPRQRRQRDHPHAGGLHRRAHPGLHRPGDAAAQGRRGSRSRDRITTLHAATEDEAVEVSRSVARSNLFKAAVFGNDPNWGRVLASIGTTSAQFDPADLDVAMNGVWVCRTSTPAEDPATVDLTGREVTVTIDLKSGDARATVWTNDLTHAYVHENSAYAS